MDRGFKPNQLIKADRLKSRVENNLEVLIDGFYPELVDYSFEIIIVKKGDYLAAHYDLPEKNKKIFVSYSLRKAKDDKIIAGCLAHELEHICISKSMNFAARIIEGLTHMLFPRALSKHEREVDKQVIKRGLGEELYLLLKFHDKYYEAYEREDGLTKAEIKEMIKFEDEKKK